MTYRILTKIKPGIMTALTTAAILWLTLAPHPLPESNMPAIPGADKIVHALMFGGFYFILLLDYRLAAKRKSACQGKNNHDRRRNKLIYLYFASIAILFGGAIELAQEAMELGRGCDVWDFTADCTGTLIASAISPSIINRLLRGLPVSPQKQHGRH